MCFYLVDWHMYIKKYIRKYYFFERIIEICENLINDFDNNQIDLENLNKAKIFLDILWYFFNLLDHEIFKNYMMFKQIKYIDMDGDQILGGKKFTIKKK